MDKSLFIKLTGAGLILGIIFSAILYGSPLSLTWDLSAFIMASTFIVPSFFSKSTNQSTPLWGIVIVAVTGLVLMVFNINEATKLGFPMAFSLLVGLYVFVFLLIANLFKRPNTYSSSELNVSNKSIRIFLTLLVTALGISYRQLGLSQIIDVPTILIFLGMVSVSVVFRSHFQNIAEDIFMTSLYSGSICFIISLIQILQNLSSTQYLILSLGNALLGSLYAFFTAIISSQFFNLKTEHYKLALFCASVLIIYIVEFMIIKYVL